MRIELPPRRKNSILLTSLVDVMFVLLFFFMLTSSTLDWGALDLDIGGGGRAARPVPGRVLKLQLLPGGQLRLDGRPLPPAQLETAVKAVADARVVVEPAPGVPLQELVGVVDRLKAAGVRLSLGRAGAPP